MVAKCFLFFNYLLCWNFPGIFLFQLLLLSSIPVILFYVQYSESTEVCDYFVLLLLKNVLHISYIFFDSCFDSSSCFPYVWISTGAWNFIYLLLGFAFLMFCSWSFLGQFFFVFFFFNNTNCDFVIRAKIS